MFEYASPTLSSGLYAIVNYMHVQKLYIYSQNKSLNPMIKLYIINMS